MLGDAEQGAASRAALVAQLQALRAPAAVIEQARGRREPLRCQVFPENEVALRVWLAMETQWRGQPMGLAGARPQGLDYVALPVVFDLLEVADRAKVFRQLQTMEIAALAAMKESENE